MTEKEISVFDGINNDAYWWVLCNDRYFATNGTSGWKKLIEAVPTLCGCAHQWWYHRHPHASWEFFSDALIWHFYLDFHEVLPHPDEGKVHLKPLSLLPVLVVAQRVKILRLEREDIEEGIEPEKLHIER
ncbi:uncharacterized protein [Medicago truncatula]|uniref:Uncharacterized protein n=1 Tax=Medicago truncatula TaxID=3880 RepID=A0A072VHL6_MEDTR|nr:uncharacterized protein LOC25482791 isoform X2 [Medicago truncatula]KEH40883.1 hypothetical protein MTR_1g036850 [Medicago truncatula]